MSEHGELTSAPMVDSIDIVSIVAFPDCQNFTARPSSGFAVELVDDQSVWMRFDQQ